MNSFCKKSWLERLGFVTNRTILNYIRVLMSTVEEVKTELGEVKAIVVNVAGDVDSLIAQVTALKEQLANGTTVTQADLDEIALSVTDLKTTLAGIDAKEPISI